MRRHSDMTDLSLLFRLQHGLIHAGAIPRFPALIDTVKLIDIDVIRLQKPQRGIQMLPKLLRRLRMRFRRKKDLVPHPLERFAQLFFAVAVSPRCIKKADAPFIRCAHQPDGLFLRHTLNRQRTKSILRDTDARSAQYDLSHCSFLLSC